MDWGNIALATFCGGETAGAADIEHLDRDPLGLQPADQHIEADAVAADDDEVGEVRAPDQLDLDRSAGGRALDMLADRDEPVRLAEGGDCARPLGVGLGGQSILRLAADQRHHQILGAAALGGDAQRQCCR